MAVPAAVPVAGFPQLSRQAYLEIGETYDWGRVDGICVLYIFEGLARDACIALLGNDLLGD